MNVTEAVSSRYSVRGYLPEPLPDELIREIFEIARLAPSNTNCQPWHVAVVSGDARVRLEAAICELADGGVPGNRDFPAAKDALQGVYQERRRACGWSYYGTMGVTREDMEGRARMARKNFEFFGAPHVAFFSMPLTMDRSNAVDMGIFLQTVMLVMQEKGVGCIAQGALATYPDPVREIAAIPEENGILFGLSFGWEDKGALINTVRMPRESLDVVASFTS
ncbi:MAG: nitroreductase [Actinomycetota bacterium]